MRCSGILLAFILGLPLLGCAEREEESTVFFHFSKRNHSKALSFDDYPDSTIQPLAGDGDFGLSTPASFSNFNCFGVFVDYPDIDSGSFCTDASSAVIAEPDDFFGLVSLDSGTATLSAKVKALPDVRFHVIAFQSSGGCPIGVGGVDSQKTTLSPPSLANGAGELRSIEGDNVTINLSASAAQRKDINDCVGPLFSFNSICNGSTATGHLEIPQGSDFLICTPQQLVSLADASSGDLSNSYILGRDLDMSTVTSKVIGRLNTADFTGTFKGNGKKIMNFNVTGITGLAGLFRKIGAGGQVRGLKLVNHNIEGDGSVGGVAGAVEDGSIRNIVYESGSVTTISATGTATDIGGIAGTVNAVSNNPVVERAIVKIPVTSSGTNITVGGGVVGVLETTTSGSLQARVKDVSYTGTLSGTFDAAGGVVGKIACNTGGTAISDVFDTYATGNVSSTKASAKVGGIAGMIVANTACNRVSAFRSYYIGTASSAAATTEVGGLVGNINNSAGASEVAIRDSFFAGNITAGATTSFIHAVESGSVGQTNNIHFTGGTCTGCSGLGSTGSTGTVTDFHNKSNAPMATGTPWDFTNVWIEASGNFPFLRSEQEL